MKIDFNSGGAKIIDRIITAYGFKTKLQLCNHLGLSSANLSMRYKRDFFPSDLVIRCMAETGVSLEWLVNGKSDLQISSLSNYEKIKSAEIVQGKLIELADTIWDKSLLALNNITKPEVIKRDNQFYLINRDYETIFSGKYLIEIEGQNGIYDLQRYPVNKLKISGNNLRECIDCKLDDIKVLAKVIGVYSLYDI